MAKVMKLWLFLGAVLVLAMAKAQAEVRFSKAELNCKSVPLKSSFEAIMDQSSSCSQINADAASLNILKRADLIGECMCNLLNRQASYESLVTGPVKRVFNKVVLIVDNQENTTDEGEFLDDLENKEASIKQQLPGLYRFPWGRPQKPLDEVCAENRGALKQVWDIFEAASKLSGEPGYGNMMTKYDSNLFILVTVFKACKALD